jgi:hypothetical protein
MTKQRAQATPQPQAPEAPHPPQAPEADRRLQLDWPQLIGFPIIALIPILAAAGMFGEKWATAEAESARFWTQVEYPARFRAKLTKPMTVAIENRSAQFLDTVDVVFDSSYVERFAAVSFIPSPREAYIVSVIGVQPGEMRRVQMQLEGELVGRHAGRIVVRAREDSATMTIRTTVFP